MQELYAEIALIGNQWMSDVKITFDENAIVTDIAATQAGESAKPKVGILIPGMINCHSHAFQRGFAGLSEYRANQSDSFWSWRDIMYQFVGKMTPEDVSVVAKFLYVEMLKAGYTSVAEFHYIHHQPNGQPYADPTEMAQQILAAADTTGISMTLLPVFYHYAGFGKQQASQAQGRFTHTLDAYYRLWEILHEQISQHPHWQLGCAPHSLRAVSDFQLSSIVNFIREKDHSAPIHIHIAEQLQEVKDCVSFYEKRPVEWLLNQFEMDKNWCLIHATHLSEEEIKHLANSAAVAGICPTTEANLGDGIFPTRDFLAAGGKIAIGSDSHIAVNIADELKMLEYAQRLTSHQRAVLSDVQFSNSVGQYLYTQCAKYGADTINQPVGEIAVGNRADFVVLDKNHSNLFAKPSQFLLDSAIFATAQLPVDSVMVAGKWVIEDQSHIHEAEITEQYRKVLAKLMM